MPRKKPALSWIQKTGRSLIGATFSREEKAKIRSAAAIEGVPMSQFLIRHGLAAADKILSEKGKNSA